MRSNTKRLLRNAATLSLLLVMAGCVPRCSLFTETSADDAGHHSFVRQIVPKLFGRKIRGQEETRVLVDVVNAVPDQRGREELVDSMLASAEFSAHWQENLLDMLRVNRIGDKTQRGCFDAPLRTSVDGRIADYLTAQRAVLTGTPPTPPAAFNMRDVTASSVLRDNLFALYSAHLFAMQTKPANGNMITEANRRTDLGFAFSGVYLHRNVECLRCHRSTFSETGAQTHWNRTYPIWGNFEKALFENEQGGNPARLYALLRTGLVNGLSPTDTPSTAANRTPWGLSSTQGLQQCGSLKAAAANTDPLGVTPYLTQSLPVGASIWDVNFILHDGRTLLARDGLQRNKPTECNVCSTPACTGGGGPPPLPQPQTNDVHNLFQANCLGSGCHNAGSFLDLQSNAPVGAWTNNLIDVPSNNDPSLKRVRRIDAPGVTPDASMLILKLKGTGPGSRMPLGRPPLTAAQIASVENWIRALPIPTDPAACNVCPTSVCTSMPAEVDGRAALAFVLALNISDQVWQELMGARVTIANYFPRTQDQMRVLWNLSEFSLLPNDWSLRAPIKHIVLSDYFNRKTPLTATPTAPYDEPLVRDPWVEIDPRLPPVALPATGGGGVAPTPDPAYKKADHPESHRNSMSEGVHRYSARSLTSSLTQALGWPAIEPVYRSLSGSDVPSAAEQPQLELYRAIGQFQRDAEPGFRDTDFQGLLKWEERFKTCGRPAGTTSDWIDRLLDATAAYNTANPSSRLKMRDVVLVMKDWFISDARIGNTTLTHDGNRNENDVIDAFFGGDVDSLDASASTPAERSALETKLREYCGVLVQTPQFWLAGIAPTGLGDPLKLRVCNGAPCTYQEICSVVAGNFIAAGSKYRVNCGTNSLTVSEAPTLGSGPATVDVNLCVGGRCGFYPQPMDLPLCLKGNNNPLQCLPGKPPGCDLGCKRIDCCGGPLPPIGADGKPRPSIMLGWFDGAKAESVRNVRWISAGQRQKGDGGLTALPEGTRLSVGDVIELTPESRLHVKTLRGEFATPKSGLPPNPHTGSWYLMVTGPSAASGVGHPPMSQRWIASRQEREFIDASVKAQREAGFAQPMVGKHDDAARLRIRVDEHADALAGQRTQPDAKKRDVKKK